MPCLNIPVINSEIFPPVSFAKLTNSFPPGIDSNNFTPPSNNFPSVALFNVLNAVKAPSAVAAPSAVSPIPDKSNPEDCLGAVVPGSVAYDSFALRYPGGTPPVTCPPIVVRKILFPASFTNSSIL